MPGSLGHVSRAIPPWASKGLGGQWSPHALGSQGDRVVPKIGRQKDLQSEPAAQVVTSAADTIPLDGATAALADKCR